MLTGQNCFSVKLIRQDLPPHLRSSEVFCNWHKNYSAVTVSQGIWGQLWGREGSLQERSDTFILLPSATQSHAIRGCWGMLCFQRRVNPEVQPKAPNAETDGLQASIWNGPSSLLRIHKARAHLCPEIAGQGLEQLGRHSSPLRESNIFACRDIGKIWRVSDNHTCL